MITKFPGLTMYVYTHMGMKFDVECWLEVFMADPDTGYEKQAVLCHAFVGAVDIAPIMDDEIVARIERKAVQ